MPGQVLLLFLVLINGLADAQAQTTRTWTGATDNLWNRAANWTPNGVPQGGDTAVINSGAPNATALGAFSIHGVNLNGGTLTANGLTVSNLNWTGGTLAGTHAVAPEGNWTWTAGTLSGRVTVENGAAATISGGSLKWFSDGAELLNSGVVTWTGGELRGQTYSGAATIRNLAGARFVINGGAALTRNYPYWDGQFIVEAGAEAVKAGGTDITSNWRLLNGGVLTVEEGVLRWNAGGASAGVFTNQAAGLLVFNGGTHTLADGARLGGDGHYQLIAGTVTASGVVTHGAAASPGAFAVAGGTLNGSTFIGAGQFHWTSGTLGGVVTLTNGATATFSSGEVKWFADGAVLNNHGTITWTAGELRGNCYSGPATVINHAGAIFHLAADGTPFTRHYGYHPFFFTNAPGAPLRKSSAGTTTLSVGNLWLTQQGELRVEGGTLDLNTPVTLADGARLTGAGWVRQTGNTVNLNGLLSLEGTSFRLQDGTLNASAGRIMALTNSLWEWTGGSLAGTLTLSNGVAAIFSGSGIKRFADHVKLHNHGTITLTGGEVRGTCYSGPATVVNHDGATFDLAADGTPFTHDYGYHHFYFTNAPGAVLRKSSPATTTLSAGNLSLTQQGELRVEAGMLDLNNPVTLANGARVTGAGLVRQTDNTVTLDGLLRLEGTTFRLHGGTFNSSDGRITTQAGSQWEWTGGSLAGTLTLSNGVAASFSGAGIKRFADHAKLHNHGTITWTGGEVRGACFGGPATVVNHDAATFHLAADGTPFTRDYGYQPFYFTNAPGALLRKSSVGTTTLSAGNLWLTQQGELRVEAGTLDLNTPATLADGSHVTGAGLLRQVGDTVALAGLITLEGTSFRVQGGTLSSSTGRIATGNAAQWEWTGGWLAGVLTLTNGAVAVLSSGAAKNFADGAQLHNHGTVTWTAGDLLGNCFGGQAILRNHASGRFVAQGITALRRHYGYQTAFFINDGLLALGTPGALISGDWRFTQGASGVVELLLAGTTAGTQFGRWTTTGAGSLEGTLRAGFAEGYRPATGSAFQFLGANPLSENFAITDLPPLYPGLYWTVERAGNAVTLRIQGEPSCLPPPSGLVSWWPGNGDFSDLAGANPATGEGGVGFAAGRSGLAFDLDGVAARVRAATPTGLPTGNAARTLALWFRTPRDPSAAVGAALMHYGSMGDAEAFGLGLSASAPGRLAFISPNQELPGLTLLQSNVWYHAAVTYDGATARLYLNGQLEATNTVALNTVTNSDGLMLGHRPNGVPWAGQLDEAVVFQRVLASAELADLHSAGDSGMCQPADVTITLSAASQPGVVGSNLVFTLTVTNAGPGDASNVTVTDPLPATVTLVSALSSQGSVTNSAQWVTAALGTLTNGATATVTLTVVPTAIGWLTNTASVAAGETDPRPGNNSATTILLVEPPDQRVLFVNVSGGYNPDGYNCYRTLTNVGAAADYVNLAASGQAAALSGIDLRRAHHLLLLERTLANRGHEADGKLLRELETCGRRAAPRHGRQ